MKIIASRARGGAEPFPSLDQRLTTMRGNNRCIQTRDHKTKDETAEDAAYKLSRDVSVTNRNKYTPIIDIGYPNCHVRLDTL
jgi:hypothetical protein